MFGFLSDGKPTEQDRINGLKKKTKSTLRRIFANAPSPLHLDNLNKYLKDEVCFNKLLSLVISSNLKLKADFQNNPRMIGFGFKKLVFEPLALNVVDLMSRRLLAAFEKVFMANFEFFSFWLCEKYRHILVFEANEDDADDQEGAMEGDPQTPNPKNDEKSGKNENGESPAISGIEARGMALTSPETPDIERKKNLFSFYNQLEEKNKEKLSKKDKEEKLKQSPIKPRSTPQKTSSHNKEWPGDSILEKVLIIFENSLNPETDKFNTKQATKDIRALFKELETYAKTSTNYQEVATNLKNDQTATMEVLNSNISLALILVKNLYQNLAMIYNFEMLDLKDQLKSSKKIFLGNCGRVIIDQARNASKLRIYKIEVYLLRSADSCLGGLQADFDKVVKEVEKKASEVENGAEEEGDQGNGGGKNGQNEENGEVGEGGDGTGMGPNGGPGEGLLSPGYLNGLSAVDFAKLKDQIIEEENFNSLHLSTFREAYPDYKGLKFHPLLLKSSKMAFEKFKKTQKSKISELKKQHKKHFPAEDLRISVQKNCIDILKAVKVEPNMKNIFKFFLNREAISEKLISIDNKRSKNILGILILTNPELMNQQDLRRHEQQIKALFRFLDVSDTDEELLKYIWYTSSTSARFKNRFSIEKELKKLRKKIEKDKKFSKIDFFTKIAVLIFLCLLVTDEDSKRLHKALVDGDYDFLDLSLNPNLTFLRFYCNAISNLDRFGLDIDRFFALVCAEVTSVSYSLNMKYLTGNQKKSDFFKSTKVCDAEERVVLSIEDSKGEIERLGEGSAEVIMDPFWAVERVIGPSKRLLSNGMVIGGTEKLTVLGSGGDGVGEGSGSNEENKDEESEGEEKAQRESKKN